MVVTNVLRFSDLDAPRIHATNKLVFDHVLKGTLITLKCEADGNPPPTFSWLKDKEIITNGITSTRNSSTLTMNLTNDEDFDLYVCTAKNGAGFYATTFNLHEEGK